MSLINEYRQTELAIKELQDRLNKLSADERLKMEIEFEQKLRSLMAEYSKSLKDIINIIDPEAAQSKAASATPRRQRTIKVYKNPHTGEVIETKGGNHKVLKAWKAEYGAETVESWAK